MAQRRRGERVLGPYSRRGKWRVIVVSGGGERTYRDYATQAEAAKVIRLALGEIEKVREKTVGEAREDYMAYLRDDKQNRPRSMEAVEYRLGLFFSGAGNGGVP